VCTNQLERGVKLLGRIARQFIDVTNCWVGDRGSGVGGEFWVDSCTYACTNQISLNEGRVNDYSSSEK